MMKTPVFLAEKSLLPLNLCSPPRTMELSRGRTLPARPPASCHSGNATFARDLKLYCAYMFVYVYACICGVWIHVHVCKHMCV